MPMKEEGCQALVLHKSFTEKELRLPAFWPLVNGGLATDLLMK